MLIKLEVDVILLNMTFKVTMSLTQKYSLTSFNF